MAIGPREAHWIVEAALARSSEGKAKTVATHMAARRAAGEPLQYVLGSQPFRGIDLEVGRGVFIPRPETELLVEEVMKALPLAGKVVDLCTGSGAVALALADERPDSMVFATELSEEAHAFALRNAERAIPAEARPSIFRGDLYEPLPIELQGRLDVIVANPPYVAARDAGRLPPDVVDHEPHQALFASEDGLEVIRRIAAGAPRWLAPGGHLVLEIGENQFEEVLGIAEGSGLVRARRSLDLAGKDRYVIARRPASWDDVLGAVTAGEVVAVPTDTVFGVAASVAHPEAIRSIFALKGRPGDKPLPVLAHNLEAAASAGTFSEAAMAIVTRHWPGPLTVVVPRRPTFDVDLGGDESKTVALRVPAHDELLRLLAATGPLAVTSANRSGEPATADEATVRRLFPGLPLLAAAAGRGVESTVVSLTGPPQILREGALSESEVLGGP